MKVIKLSPKVFEKFVEKLNKNAERLEMDLRKMGSVSKEQ